MRKYSNSIFEAAKALRGNPTKAEKLLWNKLKSRKLDGIKFRFQVPYDSFILDFLCPSNKIIIELDGPIHNLQKQHDKARDEYFEAKGYRILRFSNDEVVYNIEKVLKRISSELATPKPPIEGA